MKREEGLRATRCSHGHSALRPVYPGVFRADSAFSAEKLARRCEGPARSSKVSNAKMGPLWVFGPLFNSVRGNEQRQGELKAIPLSMVLLLSS